jgi:hypothetical protein
MAFENYKFPFPEAKQLLINLTRDGLPSDLKNSADLLVNLHLDEGTFPMSDMSDDDQKDLYKLIENGASTEEVKSKLTLENTGTPEGIFRVMVRTHLNKTGAGQVSMGVPAKRKTRSPRVLNYTDTVNVSKATETDIIIGWLKFALENRDSNKPELYYDDRAINALEALLYKLKRDGTILSKWVSANTLERELNADRGWCGIVLGIITGLNYLRSENWIELRDKSFKNDLTYMQIDSMIKDCQDKICGYGYALSGSFFGDLGSPYFVKDDVHVRDGINALFENLSSSEKRVEVLIKSAQNIGVKPRVLDKILYLGGSGNYYLIGQKLNNSRSIKMKFIEGLKTM